VRVVGDGDGFSLVARLVGMSVAAAVADNVNEDTR
jgi:hypothetical protein